MKGAIIGFGNIALNGHLPGFRQHKKIEIVAVFDPVESRRKECAAALPNAHFYSDIDEMFRIEELDLVDIATPPSSHGALVINALEHDIHAMCEKPLVLDAEELQKIDSLVRSSGKIVFTVHNWRYSPVFLKTSEIVSSGRIGKVKDIGYQVIRVKPSVAVGEDAGTNWRLDPAVAGGGILVDHGWHAFYMVNEWMGKAPVTAECSFENRKFTNMPVEDTATARFSYTGGANAELFFTWAGDERRNYVFITGEDGKINVLDNRIVVETGEGREEIKFNEGLSQGSHHPEWYGSIVGDFIAEMEGDTPAGANFIEASCCFRMLDACRRSVMDNRCEGLSCNGTNSMS